MTENPQEFPNKKFEENKIQSIESDLEEINEKIDGISETLLENTTAKNLAAYQDALDEKRVILTQLKNAKAEKLGDGHREVQQLVMEIEKTKARFDTPFSAN